MLDTTCISVPEIIGFVLWLLHVLSLVYTDTDAEIVTLLDARWKDELDGEPFFLCVSDRHCKWYILPGAESW